MENANHYDQSVQTVRVRDIIRSAWVHKIHCCVIVAAFVLVAIIWLSVTTPTYKATMVVMASDSLVGGGGSTASQLSSMGSVFGLDIGGNADVISYFNQNLALMRSVDLARLLDTKYDLKKRIFADLWDAKAENWHPPTSMTGRLKLVIKSILGYPDWVPPDDVSLATYLGRRIGIVEHEPGTSLKRLEFTHRDPEFALQVMTWVFEESNGVLRGNLQESNKKMIDYLSNRVIQIKNSEHREVLFSLIAEQERTLLLLEGTDNPGATILDSPTVSKIPAHPKYSLTLVLSFLVGSLAAVGYAFARMSMP